MGDLKVLQWKNRYPPITSYIDSKNSDKLCIQIWNVKSKNLTIYGKYTGLAFINYFVFGYGIAYNN